MRKGLPDRLREPFSVSLPVRRRQYGEVDSYLDSLVAQSPGCSRQFLQLDYSDAGAYLRSIVPYRRLIRKMIGYPPPAAVPQLALRVEQVGEDRAARYERVWVEVLKGVTAYGLLLTPHNAAAETPLLIALHGGGGCPEAVCGLDTRENYHAFGREAAGRGYIVWAPSLLMQVAYGGDPAPDRSRHFLDRKARLVGTSIVAIEVYKIIGGLKAVIEARSEIDARRIGMAGLSYGGLFTLYTLALSEFIAAGACAGFFGSLSDWPAFNSIDPEKAGDCRFMDVLGTFDLPELCGLICPRPLMIQHGKKDAVLPVEGARAAAKLAGRYFADLGCADRFTYSEHPGAHEFANEDLFSFFAKALRESRCGEATL